MPRRKSKAPVFTARETHRGAVRVAHRRRTQTTVETLTRDQAALLAVELVVAVCGLSAAEVADHFLQQVGARNGR